MPRIRVALIAALSVMLAVGSAAAWGQRPAGPPPGRPGRVPETRQMTGRVGPTIVQVPVEWIEGPLALTSAQKTKLVAIRTNLNNQMQGLFRQQQPRDQATWRAAMGKLQGLSAAAAKQADAVLTPAQRSKVPGVLSQVGVLSRAGIPPAVMGDLKLTPGQVSKLEGVTQAQRAKMRALFPSAPRPGGPGATGPGARPGRPGQPGGMTGSRVPFERLRALQTETHKKALAVLTPAQRAIVAKYEKAHPRPTMPRAMRGPMRPGGPMGPGGPMMRPGGPAGPGGPRR